MKIAYIEWEKKPRTLGKVQKIKDLEGVGHPVMYLVGDDAHAEARLLHGSLHPPLVQPGVIHLDTAAKWRSDDSTQRFSIVS